MPDTPAFTLVAHLEAGDWDALRRALSQKETPASLLTQTLAEGRCPETPPPPGGAFLPSYSLKRSLGDPSAVVARLCQIARETRAAGNDPLAADLYRTALAFDPRCAEASLALAWDSYARGDRCGAVDRAERAVQATPNDAEAATTLGWLYWEAGRGEAATRTLCAAVDRHPRQATAYWYLGHICARQGRLAEAERLLRHALALAADTDAPNGEIAASLSWVLADLGRLDEALTLAHDTARRDPAPRHLAHLGRLLTQKGEYEAALVLLDRATAERPGDWAATADLATALSRTGRGREALTLIETALAAAPDERRLALRQATLLRDGGAHPQAALIAAQIVERWPDWGEGWFLRGQIKRDDGQDEEALDCFARAQACDPSLIAAILERSRLLLRLGRAEAAAGLMEDLLREAPGHPAARKHLAWALIGQRKGAIARPQIHILLQSAPRAAELWTALSTALHQMGRLTTARLAARRARRLAPTDCDALRHGAALELEAGDLSATSELCHRLLHLAPTLPAAHIMAGFAHQASGRLVAAERHAEQAIALAPKDAEAWRCLGHLRHHQNRLAEAEEALHNAHALAPGRGDVLGQLAWVLVMDDRLPEALIVMRKACDLTPESAERALEQAEMLALAGRPAEAIIAATRARDLGPSPLAAQALLARIHLSRGHIEAGDGDTAWAEAARCAATLLYRDPSHLAAAHVAVRLAAAGQPRAADLVALLPSALHRRVLREGLEWVTGFGNAREATRLTRATRAAFPEDRDLTIACLYLETMAGQAPAADTARQLRQWGLEHAQSWGPLPPRPRLAATPGRPLHVAYLASRYHHALLSGILATHDRAVVVPHLYTDDAEALPPDLRSRVIVHPLGGVDLAASCAANGIDVVVDTVGLHPFHGQAEVLRFLRRRLAPSQWGWFGGWGPGSGLFDGLITDTVALPAAADHHDEDILALAGGQWSWTPPAVAPAIGPLPSAQTGIITFGCAVRGFRISRSCLETWADLLAGMDNARLMILGRQAHDWEFRAGFSRLLQACGIAPERVVYRFQQAYADHLHSFAGIDIALDTFPANGGLCLADALWMGVPVVTLAGTGLLAERQGASLLAAADCGDWIARSPADYLAIARKLAGDRQDLALIRHTLRDRLGASPLLDARRITSQLEAAWLKARDAMAGITAAPDLKSRSQALAKRDLAVWLGRERSLTLPPSQGADDAPDLSVVIVLYNQAGLSLRTLIALADQQGVRFETIIVDNASTDETPALLARVRGATLLRNEDNIGFLRAANQGAAVARGKHIVFLNNDVFLHRDALAAALRRLRADPSIGVVGGRVVLIDGSLQEAGCMVFNDGSTAGYGRGEDPNLAEFRFLREVDYVSGAFLMLPRALWRALGGFEPALAPAYYEDTDLCLRVHRAGFRVVYDPAVVLTHVEGGSTVTSDAAAAMIRRNRGAFLARHAEALRSRPSPAAARPLRDRWAPAPAPRVLVIDNGVPHSAGGAGNPRARLMIEALAGCHVTFFPMWVRESDWAAVYRTLGAEVEVMLDQHATTLEDFLDHRQGLYDVLVVSRPPNMAIVKAIGRRRPDLLKGMRLVYDAEALFALRDIAQAAITARPLPRTEARRRLRDELDLAAGADTVLAVSRREARLFSAGGAAKVHLVSHALPAHPAPPGRDGRSGFLFLGALTPGSPNEDSLVWLVESVLPALARRLPRPPPHLSILGECRSSRIAALAGEQVRLVGRVEDPAPWYDQAAVFVAPTRFAAGIPLKVIEAAAAGLPVVATPLLARQLGWSTGDYLLAAGDAEGFAAAMAALYTDGALWRRIRDGALARVSTENAPDRFRDTLREAVLGRGIG